MVTRTFAIPIPTSVWIFLVALVAILAVIILITIIPIVALKIEVKDSEIVISAPPLLKYSFKRNEIVSINTIDLSEHEEYKPTLREFGIGIPGYRIGWFKLANGAKAFLAVSSNEAVVFKLKNGTYVIITPKDVGNFLNTLRKLEWI